MRIVSLVATASLGQSEGARLPTFELLAYTGRPFSPETTPPLSAPVVIDLAGVTSRSGQLSVLKDHDPKAVVGHSTGIEVSGSNLIVRGVVSGTGPAAIEVVANAKNGYEWQVSIGASLGKLQFVAEGASVPVNGMSVAGPLYVARASRLREISFLSLGADDETVARIAARSAAGVMAMTFEKWLSSLGFDPAALTPDQLEQMQALFAVVGKATPPGNSPPGNSPPGDPAESQSAAADLARTSDDARDLRAELDGLRREVRIRALCADHPEVQVNALAGNWADETIKLAIEAADLRKKIASPPMISAGSGESAVRSRQDVIAAAVAMTAGIPAKLALEGLDEAGKNVVMSKAMRGFGLQSLLAVSLQAAGRTAPHNWSNTDAIREAFLVEQGVYAQATGWSSISFTGILGNTLNKGLLAAYEAAASVVGDIAYETDTNDFKAFKRYRLTASGTVAAVPPDGSLPALGLQDTEFSNQLSTYGAIITLSRQMIVNDDLGAFAQAPTLLGRAIAIARERAVFAAILANTSSFFGTGHKNYSSGGGSAIGIAGLNAAVQKFREQTDANGDALLITPDRVLVPPALEGTAKQLYTSTTVVASTTSNAPLAGGNPHQSMFRPVVSPFLSSAGAPSGSTGSDANWYLLGDPTSGSAIVQVGYLRGTRTPTVEQGALDFDKLGVGYRAYFDFGVALHDYRAGVKSIGS